MINEVLSKMSEIDRLRVKMLSSLEDYTRAMFKAQYKRNFAVSEHHRLIFQKLQDVVDGKITRLIINMPPRYGKTEVCVKAFTSWAYALNPSCRFLHLSYSDTLVNDNSATIRSMMAEPLYKELFPESALAKEKGATDRWKTKAGGEFYAVSTQGQVTGFGAGKVDDEESEQDAPLASDLDLSKVEPGSDIEMEYFLRMLDSTTNIFEGAIVIDDPLKPEDAESEITRERVNNRFETTIRNRVNSRRTPIIIIMQRLHEHDLCGYLQEIEPDEWEVLSLPALKENERTGEVSALWPLKHTVEELEKLRKVNPTVFDTQYMQDPTPVEGLMYSSGFGTYSRENLPTTGTRVNYTDTADTGSDDLCSICGIEAPLYTYVTDVLFTDKPMEHTEPQTAAMLNRNNTQKAWIESNNGGRGFARKVKELLMSNHKNTRVNVRWFHQSNNKQVRIATNSASVQNTILFPEGWDKLWPQFYRAITTYRKDNKRKRQKDDAPDALTGLFEIRGKSKKKAGIKREN